MKTEFLLEDERKWWEAIRTETCSEAVAVLTMLSRLAELREQQRWIPISERLPEMEQYVLIYGRAEIGIRITVRFITNHNEWEFAGTNKALVTHWRPLPDPPKEDKYLSAAT